MLYSMKALCGASHTKTITFICRTLVCCLSIVFSGCPYGTDDVWDILWPNAPGGSINMQPCPGGVDTNGKAAYICSL